MGSWFSQGRRSPPSVCQPHQCPPPRPQASRHALPASGGNKDKPGMASSPAEADKLGVPGSASAPSHRMRTVYMN